MAIDKALLGKGIRQIRELRGMSQAALAEQIGMRGNSVALVERGLRGVSMGTLNAIADSLEVPAACLAILGTARIAGDAGSTALVKSMQKLIVATVGAQAQPGDDESATSGTRHRLAKRTKSTRRKATKQRSKKSKLGSTR